MPLAGKALSNNQSVLRTETGLSSVEVILVSAEFDQLNAVDRLSLWKQHVGGLWQSQRRTSWPVDRTGQRRNTSRIGGVRAMLCLRRCESSSSDKCVRATSGSLHKTELEVSGENTSQGTMLFKVAGHHLPSSVETAQVPS